MKEFKATSLPARRPPRARLTIVVHAAALRIYLNIHTTSAILRMAMQHWHCKKKNNTIEPESEIAGREREVYIEKIERRKSSITSITSYII